MKKVTGKRADAALYLCHVSPCDQLGNNMFCPECDGDSLWGVIVGDDESEADNEFIVCKECESVFQD